jgi:hypothetical protein
MAGGTHPAEPSEGVPCPAVARTLRRLGALAGIAGPVAFTTAWAVGGHRQSGYPVPDEHISGLAARDADHPRPMMAGFFSLGAGTLALAGALQATLGPSLRRAGPGPALLGLGGVAQLVAGALRRDTVLLNPPGRPDDWRQSRVNDGHDAAAGVAFTCAVAVPLTLAARFAGDPAWRSFTPVALVCATVSGALMAFFATDVDRHGNGVVQRAMVTVPQAFQVALAVRLLSS